MCVSTHIHIYRFMYVYTSMYICMMFSTYSGKPSENGRSRRKKLDGQKALINGFWANLKKSRVISTRDLSKNPLISAFWPLNFFLLLLPFSKGVPEIRGPLNRISPEVVWHVWSRMPLLGSLVLNISEIWLLSPLLPRGCLWGPCQNQRFVDF